MGSVPAVFTEKEAVCPAVTVWLAGAVAIDGATGVELLLLETTPAQPEFANPASTATRTRAQRFIMCLFHKVFSGIQLSCMGKNIQPELGASRKPVRAGRQASCISNARRVPVSPQLLAGPESGL